MFSQLKKLSAIAALGACAAISAQAQPVTVVVPYTASGPTTKYLNDMLPALSKSLGGVAINVKNVPSANGYEGIVEVAKSSDPNTILFTNINIGLLPAARSTLPYTLNDFGYLGLTFEMPMVLISNPNIPAKDSKELLAWIKSKNDKNEPVKMAHGGVGSSSYLCGIMLQSILKQKFQITEYKGTGPAEQSIVNATEEILCDQIANVDDSIIEQKVRAYAVSMPQRLKLKNFSQLPTFREAFKKDIEINIYNGFYAPKSMPAARQKQISEAIHSAVRDQSVMDKLDKYGAQLIIGARAEPKGHASYVKSTSDLWKMYLMTVSKDLK